MSTTFVVPYPPGFPVLVPGQVVSKEIVYFLAQLDVKEIHGYNHDLGLSVFTQAALARWRPNGTPRWPRSGPPPRPSRSRRMHRPSTATAPCGRPSEDV